VKGISPVAHGLNSNVYLRFCVGIDVVMQFMCMISCTLLPKQGEFKARFRDSVTVIKSEALRVYPLSVTSKQVMPTDNNDCLCKATAVQATPIYSPKQLSR
jgi:hypothetical protein